MAKLNEAEFRALNEKLRQIHPEFTKDNLFQGYVKHAEYRYAKVLQEAREASDAKEADKLFERAGEARDDLANLRNAFKLFVDYHRSNTGVYEDDSLAAFKFYG